MVGFSFLALAVVLLVSTSILGQIDAFAAPPTTSFQRYSAQQRIVLQPLTAMSTEDETTATTTATITRNPRDEGLALLLDDGTRKSHSIAENTGT